MELQNGYNNINVMAQIATYMFVMINYDNISSRNVHAVIHNVIFIHPMYICYDKL